MYDYFVINPSVAEIWEEDRKRWSKEQLEFLEFAIELCKKEFPKREPNDRS